MHKLLVFGASGAVGRFLLPRLPRDVEVFPVSRGEQAGWTRGDLCDPASAWPECDTALSLGPLDAFAGWARGVRMPSLHRIVAFSSMSAQSKRESADPHERQLSQRLRASEDVLWLLAHERDIAVTIFRPTLIYGAGIDRSLAPVARFVRRWHVLPSPTNALGLRQPVHAADLAGAVIAATDNEATFGKTYELGGDERLTFRDMIERVRIAQPVRSVSIPVPSALLRAATRWRKGIGPAAFDRLATSLIADNTAAARDFGYSPRAFEARDVLTAAASSSG